MSSGYEFPCRVVRFNMRPAGKKREQKRMNGLVTDAQVADADVIYTALVEARRGLSEGEAAALDTRLVLILANHIGDIAVLREAIALAKNR